MRVAYLVHDLNDPAVPRRVRMLHASGATVALLGFCRGAPPAAVEGITPVLLGRTADARFARRAASVLRAAAGAARWRGAVAGADAVLARQIETLALAALARRRPAPLVFECLDVHRLMASPGIAGRALRLLERRLLPLCQGLVVSSPEFVARHFAPLHARLPPVTLIENKVLAFELPEGRAPAGPPPRPAGPPWRIGWFGMIRCARSLRLLAALAASRPGEIEVVIRGRVAASAVPDFDAVVAASPGLSFGGPYDRARDLPRLYGDVHFAWAVDFFEAGGNSDWLLPNRLYEAGLFGAVPIACRDVAAGAWLARRGAGVLLDGDPAQALGRFFAGLDAQGWLDARRRIAGLPRGEFVYDADDCRTLLDRALRPAPEPVPA